ncbi:MAG: toxic anion resistance protein [Defluviitaleaceae bacterium]|nr:toxic anion resistance protein [Defluviitaleaceae bacterium]
MDLPNEIKSDLKSIEQLDRPRIEELKKELNFEDASSVLRFGASAQNNIAKFSDSILQNVRTKDVTGEIGKDLTDLAITIKDFDEDGNEKKGAFGLFRNAKKSVEKMAIRYESVEKTIDRVVSSLETHERQLMKDVAILDQIYEKNFEYFKDLSHYITAGEESLEEYKHTNIEAQREIATREGTQLEIQKLNDMEQHANRFEKKLHDLKLSRTISLQMAPQIRLIQNNNTVLIEKIQSSIVNSIPLWKNQIVISLGIHNSQKALKAQKEITDMTNDLLMRNSELLKQGSLEIARESEKSIVSTETLKKTNENLIATINGIIEIQKKGGEERKLAEIEIQRIEEELKRALLEAR